MTTSGRCYSKYLEKLSYLPFLLFQKLRRTIGTSPRIVSML
ncbi:hypothetical protein FTV88_0216 [Heliorestis convoluta]|uniref:Uncharacterized protein n=1 Tax=Heliorestis convoluta TaxID=356322 RepID=A0A5Q2N1H2_9FIRM|nr:hypothetical protein FTV88_0216 [Heliorestis convoluta]